MSNPVPSYVEPGKYFNLSLTEIAEEFSNDKYKYYVRKEPAGTTVAFSTQSETYSSTPFNHAYDARYYLINLIEKHLAEDKLEMTLDKLNTYIKAYNEMEQYASTTGCHINVIGSSIADTRFSIYWNQDPDKFNGTFTDPVEALAAMTAFIGTLSMEAPEEQTSYVLHEMQETAKDLHAAGVMTEQTMEKFQEPTQDTKEAWWNGARAALGLPFDTPRSEVSENFLSKPKPSLENFLSVLHESVELSSYSELKDAVKLIIEVQAMDSGMRDCIRATFLNGPLDDGDVPSKSGRDTLLTSGYISKVVVKGEEGFNALTYKGARAYRLIKAGA